MVQTLGAGQGRYEADDEKKLECAPDDVGIWASGSHRSDVGRVWHHTRLEIHEDSKALDAVVEAATCLNCPIGEIQVKGPEWPLYPEKN